MVKRGDKWQRKTSSAEYQQIKIDYYGEDKNLEHYRTIMNWQCELPMEERIEFIRMVLAQRTYYGFGNMFTEFVKYAKKRKRAASLTQKKEVFIALESIIGNSCFNGNIQNYSSWGGGVRETRISVSRDLP